MNKWTKFKIDLWAWLNQIDSLHGGRRIHLDECIRVNF